MKRILLLLALTGSSALAAQPGQLAQQWVAKMSAVRSGSAACDTFVNGFATQGYPNVPTAKFKFIEAREYKLDLDPATNKSLVELYGSLANFETSDAWDDNDGTLTNIFVNTSTLQYAYPVALFADSDDDSKTDFCLVIAALR